MEQAVEQIANTSSLNWEGIVAVVALVVALFDLFLHIKEYWKEGAKLRIIQDDSHSFYLSFIYYQKYHCAIVYLSIDNKSKSEIALSLFRLVIEKRGEFLSREYSGGDRFNENGISLYPKGKDNEYHNFNIKSENLLHNNHIQGYGNVKGYLYFEFPEQILTQPVERATLYIDTPRKTFKKKICIFKQETLRPLNPLEK